MAEIEAFRQHVLDAGVLDPEGTHHEFVSGMHGRKLDFDIIDTESELYDEWVDVSEDFIRHNYATLPYFIIGVANGTNRLALDVARRFRGESVGLVSEKDEQESKVLRLAPLTEWILSKVIVPQVVILEDVGTTGSNSVQVAEEVRKLQRKSPEVIVTWKRREKLERLEEAGITYRAVIDEPLTTYSPDECQEAGYCWRGWEFIPRSR